MLPLLPLLSLLACTDTPSPKSDGSSTDTEPKTCANDDACSDGYICEETSCIAGDRNNDATTAASLFWETDVAGLINPAGDTDWYAITAEGGEFARIQVDTLEDENELNSVVSVYNAAGHRLSWEDEHPAGNVSTYDSVCYAYFGDAGTYYIKVEDYSTFFGETPVGGFDSDYVLTVKAAAVGSEPDSGQEPGNSVDVAEGSIWAIPWLMDEESDIDFVDLTLPYKNTWLTIVGAAHIEASTAAPEYLLANKDGTAILLKDGPTADDPAIYVGTQSTKYVLGIRDAFGGGGSDVWGAAFVQVYGADFGGVPETEANDDVASANPLPLEAINSNSGVALGGFVQGTLAIDVDGSGDDSDVFEISVPSDDTYLSLIPRSRQYGSLVIPTVEVMDEAGVVIETQAGDGADPILGNLQVNAGTYYLRITGTTLADADEAGYYYLIVYATDFEVAL